MSESSKSTDIFSNSGVTLLGSVLKLRVFGTSHGSCIGMELDGFPRGMAVDMAELQSFMERRAPGRDSLSTRRRESDAPVFQTGITQGVTTGGRLCAVLENRDCRPGDYATSIPRPGHADYTQWIQTGRIPSGGGMHSGRMTAPICLAGGLCLQWLKPRGVRVSSRLLSAGGDAVCPEEAIRSAGAEGDSVGGLLEVRVEGLPLGLGGALFQGVETRLAAAMFSIPGVKGFEIGDGFALASMRGSEANDPFEMCDGAVVMRSNRHGGLLGGITTGMPVVMRLALKPTPSIYKPQPSVDLHLGRNAVCDTKGRHDPCIARRALPVAEALAAFVFMDLLLEDEARHPRLCLTLTERSLSEALAVLKRSLPFVDLCELRADYLSAEELPRLADFPERAGLPVLLTIRRPQDGGEWHGSEEARRQLLEHALSSGSRPFAFVDFEDDVRDEELENHARSRGTRIIRSLHRFDGPVEDLVARARALHGNSEDIPKIACMVRHCGELARLFQETAAFTDFPHIICGMGVIGQASRILAERTHSMLTFCTAERSGEKLAGIGHLTPQVLVERYGFRQLDSSTRLFAVTGWPLEHTRSPELNNRAFFAEGQNAVMVPLPAETAEEALRCAEVLGVCGMAVTIPHKRAMLPLMVHVTPEAAAIGAVNTVIRTAEGWLGANTDIAGFQKVLLDFLGVQDLKGRRVALLGAGGAATAVAYVLSRLGCQCCIFNRTLATAEALAAPYHFQSAPLSSASLPLLKQYGGIIIQATSLGLSSGPCSEGDPIPFYEFQGTEQLLDLIYSPAETPVMARARCAGCRVENGLGMLVEQAKEQRRLYALHASEAISKLSSALASPGIRIASQSDFSVL